MIYNLTQAGCRHTFRTAKPEVDKIPDQFFGASGFKSVTWTRAFKSRNIFLRRKNIKD